MGWLRTLLLGDIGNRLDIADAENQIERVRRSQQRQSNVKNQKIAALTHELGRQKLAVQALTRFLIEKGIVDEGELSAFVEAVDAEDGVIDGKMELDSTAPKPRVPEGTFRKIPGKRN